MSWEGSNAYLRQAMPINVKNRQRPRQIELQLILLRLPLLVILIQHILVFNSKLSEEQAVFLVLLWVLVNPGLWDAGLDSLSPDDFAAS